MRGRSSFATPGSTQTRFYTQNTSYHFTGLLSGTAYYIGVLGIKDGVNGWHAGITCSTLTVAPSGLGCVAGASSLRVSWNQVAGASEYRVSRGAGWVTVSGTTADFWYLDSATAYTVRVQAGNGSGWGESASTTCSTSASSLAAPSNLVCEASPSSLRLRWDPVAGATGYQAAVVFSGSPVLKTVTGTEALFTGLDHYTGYFLGVHAWSGSVSQAFASKFCFTSLPPTAPTGLVCGAGFSHLDVSWDTVPQAASYRARVSGEPWTAAAGTSVRLGDLSRDTSYTVQVQSGSGSDWSAAAQEDCTTRAEPRPLQCTSVTTSSVTLSLVDPPGVNYSYWVDRLKPTGLEYVEYETLRGGQTTATFTGLSPGTGHRFLLWHNPGKHMVLPPKVCTTLGASPGVPTGVSCAAESTRLTVSWDEVDGASRYRVSRGNGWVTVSGTSHVFSLLEPETTYAVEVQAGDDDTWGESVWGPSGTLTCATTKAPLPAPTGLACQASASVLVVSWNAVEGADEYEAKLQLAVVGSTQNKKKTTTTQVTYTGLESGTKYFIGVLGIEDGVIGWWSGVNCTTLHSAPTGLGCVAEATRLTVSWDEVVDAAEYRVTLGDGWVTTTAESHVFSLLEPETGYTVRVQASNGTAWGQTGSVTCATTTAPLAKPTGFACEATSEQMRVSWDPVVGADEYEAKLQLAVVGSTQTKKKTTTTEVTFTGLESATRYFIGVLGIQNGVIGHWSGVTCTTLGDTPDAPTGLDCTAAGTEITVTWDEVDGATGYRVSRGNGWADTTTTTHTFTHLTADTDYTVRAQAGNDMGWGASAIRVCSTGQVWLPAPTGLSCAATADSIQVTWDPVTGADGYAAKLQVAEAGSTQYEQITTTTSTLYTDLLSGTEYFIGVLALKDDKAQHWAGVYCTTLTTIAAPAGLTCVAGVSELTVDWDKVDGARRYRVSRGNGWVTIWRGPRVFGFLTPGDTYVVRVQAGKPTTPGGSDYHWGEEAALACTTTRSELAAPTGLACRVSLNELTISWDPVEGADGYGVRMVETGYSEYNYAYVPLEETQAASFKAEHLWSDEYFIAVYGVKDGDTQDWTGIRCSPSSMRKPQGLAVDAPLPTELELTWDSLPGATRYRVSRGDEWVELPAGANSFVFRYLKPDTAYTLWVQAGDDVAWRGAGYLNAKTAVSVLAAPAGLGCAASATQLWVTWDQVAGAEGYAARLQQATPASAYTETTVDAEGVVFDDLLAATEYFVGVLPLKGGVAQDWSGVNCTTLEATPTGLACTAGFTRLHATWVPAPGTDNHQVSLDGGDWIDATGVSHRFDGLTHATSYVVAVRSDYDGTWSDAATETCATLVAPVGPECGAATDTGITLVFAHRPGPAPMEWQVWKKAPGGQWSQPVTVTDSNATQITYNNLASGETHEFQLRWRTGPDQLWNTATPTASCDTVSMDIAPPECKETTSQTVVLAWDAHPMVAQWKVARDTNGNPEDETILESDRLEAVMGELEAGSEHTFFFWWRKTTGDPWTQVTPHTKCTTQQDVELPDECVFFPGNDKFCLMPPDTTSTNGAVGGQGTLPDGASAAAGAGSTGTMGSTSQGSGDLLGCISVPELLHLWQVRAARDIYAYFGGYRFTVAEKGEEGGWVQKKENLDQTGGAWINGAAQVVCDAVVTGNSRVYGNAVIAGNAEVSGNAVVYGNAIVAGNAEVHGNARVGGWARVYGNAKVYQEAQVAGGSSVYGNATIRWRAWVIGDLGQGITGKDALDSVQVHGNAHISGDARIRGKADVSYARVYDNARIHGNAEVSGTGTFVYGDADISGNAKFYGPVLREILQEDTARRSIYGNTTVAGNAKIHGNTTIHGKPKKVVEDEEGQKTTYDGVTVKGNADISGETFIRDYATVDGATVDGNARVEDYTHVHSGAHITGDARVYGNAEVSTHATIRGQAHVYGDAFVGGPATVDGNANIYGEATVFGTSGTVDRHVYIDGNVWVYDQATVCRGARVSGSTAHGPKRGVYIFDGATVCGILPTWSDLTPASLVVEVSDEATIEGEASVYEQAKIYGNAVINGSARVFSAAEVFGFAHVTGKVSGDPTSVQVVVPTGGARVYGNAKVLGDARVYEVAEVFGDAVIESTTGTSPEGDPITLVPQVFGHAKVFGNAKVYDNAKVYGHAQVFDDSYVYGNAQVYGHARIFTYSSSEYVSGMTSTKEPIFAPVFEEDYVARTFWTNSFRRIHEWNGPRAEVEDTLNIDTLPTELISEEVEGWELRWDAVDATIEPITGTRILSNAVVADNAMVWGSSQVINAGRVLQDSWISGGSLVKGGWVCGTEWHNSEKPNTPRPCTEEQGLFEGIISSAICFTGSILTLKMPVLSGSIATVCFLREL